MRETVLKVIVLSLLIPASLVVLINRSHASGARDQNGSTPSGQAAPPEKTVEQSFKNIKLLTGMPQSQLYPTMVFVSSSLGVQCDHCHVSKNGQLDFAADDKPEKQTARTMIKMVLEINKTFAQGNPEVSCYTCHRGRTSPQAFPTLPLPLPSPRPSAVSAANAPSQPSPIITQVLPSADEVLNRYLTAMGGRTAIERIKSCVIKGTSAIPNGQPAAYETDQIAPDKGYESRAAQSGLSERAVNGARGWLSNDDGVQELAGEQVADTRLLFPLFMNLRLTEQYSRMRVSGRDKIDDREVYVVSANRTDNKSERLFFDAANGLLLRRISYTRTMIGVIPQQTDFGDYREVEGVKFPFTIRTSFVDARNPIVTRKFEEIMLNVPIDESKFNKPAGSRPASR